MTTVSTPGLTLLEKRSYTTELVEPLSHDFSSKVRTPLKSGRKPSLQIMRRAGTIAENLGLKVRLVPGTCRRSCSPSRI